MMKIFVTILTLNVVLGSTKFPANADVWNDEPSSFLATKWNYIIDIPKTWDMTVIMQQMETLEIKKTTTRKIFELVNIKMMLDNFIYSLYDSIKKAQDSIKAIMAQDKHGITNDMRLTDVVSLSTPNELLDAISYVRRYIIDVEIYLTATREYVDPFIYETISNVLNHLKQYTLVKAPSRSNLLWQDVISFAIMDRTPFKHANAAMYPIVKKITAEIKMPRELEFVVFVANELVLTIEKIAQAGPNILQTYEKDNVYLFATFLAQVTDLAKSIDQIDQRMQYLGAEDRQMYLDGTAYTAVVNPFRKDIIEFFNVANGVFTKTQVWNELVNSINLLHQEVVEINEKHKADLTSNDITLIEKVKRVQKTVADIVRCCEKEHFDLVNEDYENWTDLIFSLMSLKRDINLPFHIALMQSAKQIKKKIVQRWDTLMMVHILKLPSRECGEASGSNNLNLRSQFLKLKGKE